MSGSILELSNPIPMDTPHGKGYALFLIDMGVENDVLWGVAIDRGEHVNQIWWHRNSDIALRDNITMRRVKKS